MAITHEDTTYVYWPCDVQSGRDAMLRGIFPGQPTAVTEATTTEGEGNLPGLRDWLNQEQLEESGIRIPKLAISFSMTIPSITGLAEARVCKREDELSLPQHVQPLGWTPSRAKTHAVQIHVGHHNLHSPGHPFRQGNNYKVTSTSPILPESCEKLIQVPFTDLSNYGLAENLEAKDAQYAPDYFNPNMYLTDEAGTSPVLEGDIAILDKETRDICEIGGTIAFDDVGCIFGDRNVGQDIFIVKATAKTTCGECQERIQNGAAHCPYCAMSTFEEQIRQTLTTTAFESIPDPTGAPFALRPARTDNKGRAVFTSTRAGKSSDTLAQGEKRNKAKNYMSRIKKRCENKTYTIPYKGTRREYQSNTFGKNFSEYDEPIKMFAQEAEHFWESFLFDYEKDEEMTGEARARGLISQDFRSTGEADW